MPQIPVTIPYHLVASAGASGKVPIYTVSPARKLRVKRVIIYFPIGNYGELEIALYRGESKILPTTGTFTGDNVVYDLDVDLEYGAEENVYIYYKNNNDSETREAFILLVGYEE